MAITETARRNHEELFPNHTSTLAETDPEFVEVFDNFAFDEALGYCELDTHTRLLAVLAALIAQHAVSEYRAMLKGALNAGVTPVEVKEIVYQAVAYVGIGRVFDFLHATNDVLAARGVRLPLEPQATTTPENRLERGLELSKSVFGELIDHTLVQFNLAARRHHVHRAAAATLQLADGRAEPARELMTFVQLAALGGCEPQLKAHIAGNAAVGNDKAKLVSVLTQLVPFLGFPRTLNALRCVNEVLGK